MASPNGIIRNLLFFILLLVGVGAAWFTFVVYPTSTRELLGIVLVVIFIPVLLKLAAGTASSIAPGYNVAEVGVTGPITRETSTSPLGTAPIGTSANAVVEQIEQANADGSVDALLVRLNTPGGEIIPSEDIKLAIERFDGPTIGYATDYCASGGYEIASGCDELWAREGSVVGSIGVIGSRVTAAELAESLGIQYEQLTAGEYKDAGVPLKDLEEHEREYLQGLIDDYYDWFVSNVADRREMEEAELRETEARVYLGWRAAERGLVDELGTREDVEDRLEELLGRQPSVRRFEPQRPLTARLQLAGQRVAYALGAGVVGTLRDDSRLRFR